jgi:hypothetical protein
MEGASPCVSLVLGRIEGASPCVSPPVSSPIPPDKRILLWLETGSRRFFKVLVYACAKTPAASNMSLPKMYSWLMIGSCIFALSSLAPTYGWLKATEILTLCLSGALGLCILLTVIFAGIRSLLLTLYLQTLDRLYISMGVTGNAIMYQKLQRKVYHPGECGIPSLM